jgi:hypothetical protein
MQLAVRWCGVAAVVASSAALAVSIAGRPSERSPWVRFDSADQRSLVECLSTHGDRVALRYADDGAIESVTAHRDSGMERCLRGVATGVDVTQPPLVGVFVPCAHAPVGEPEMLGKVFLDSSEQLARCVLGGPERLHVWVSRAELGALVFDPADIPSASCVGTMACGHRYRFDASAAQGIVISVP